MSALSSRRVFLCATGAALLLPLFPASALSQAGRRRIAPPSQSMLFRRELRRELPGGYAVVASREFEIAFRAIADGFRIDGRQVASSLDAPPSLEAYARLERERREDGIFPLRLDGYGLILSGPASVSGSDLEQAVTIALEQISAGLETQEEQAEARSFVLGLRQAADTISSALPEDLFVPPEIPQQASRSILLPDGMSGELSVEYSGRVSTATGLLDEARRVIVTDAMGERRRTVESWTLRESGSVAES